jgi:peptidoglycan/LPS O-acetylase OafA/YrhL
VTRIVRRSRARRAAPAGWPVPAATSGSGPHRVVLLDGLRLGAALSVLLFHYVSLDTAVWGASADQLSGLRAGTDYGWLGVDLFFMISGFVICGSAWGRQVGDFAVSRIVRIYPVYVFAVLLTAAALIVLRWHRHTPSAPQILANLTMWQTLLGARDLDGPYWTLPREVLFYLCFALVVWRGLTYRRAVTFCVLWTVTSLIAPSAPGLPLGLLANPQSTPYFVAGITLYLMHRFGQTLLLYALLALQLLLAEYGLTHQAHGYAEVLGRPLRWPVAAAGVAGCFLVLLVISVTGLGRVRSRWLTWAGGLTYPLYLIHQSIGLAAIARLRGTAAWWLLLVGVAAGMLVVAAAIHLLERRFTPGIRRGLVVGLAQLRTAGSDQGRSLSTERAQEASVASKPARNSGSTWALPAYQSPKATSRSAMKSSIPSGSSGRTDR